MTRLNLSNEYARIDYCIAGFRGLINRLAPQLDDAPLAVIERKLAAGVPLTIHEIDTAFSFLKQCEQALVGLPSRAVLDAVQTEQIAIELEQLGLLKEAA